ncbi:MAG: hypothetical protein U0V70_04455 [Terriglobia bacterium]
MWTPLVEGTVQRSGDHVRITANLLHAPTDRHVWAESYERNLRDVLSIQGEVARSIANEVRIKLTPEERMRLSMGRSHPVQPEAFELYLKGRYYYSKWTPDGFRRRLSISKKRSKPIRAGLLLTRGLQPRTVGFGLRVLCHPKKHSPNSRPP